MRLRINPKYKPLILNQSRNLVLYGGAGSGKSVFAAQKIILRTISELGHKFLILRKVGNTIKNSIFSELLNSMDNLGIRQEFKINKTNHSFYHKLTGNEIICSGMDEPEKIKSISGVTGIWVEEATEFTTDDLNQLMIRIRGIKENYVQYIYSFNPIDETHHLKKRFFDDPIPDTVVCHSTYQDNLFLTDQDKGVLESMKDIDPLYYQVYCLGLWGITVKTDKFLYAFDQSKHIIESYEPSLKLPILVSFDFNVNPMTAVIGQEIFGSEKSLRIFDEFELKDSSTEELSERILSKYKDWQFRIDITGDATGANREKATRGNISQYHVIKSVFKLTDRQIRVRSKNMSLKDSRVICNSILTHADVKLTKNCVKTIKDVTFAEVKINPMTHKLDVLKTEKEGRHHFDNFRYLLECAYPDFVRVDLSYKNS